MEKGREREKRKKNGAFGLNVRVGEGQPACSIIYFLITFILSRPRVSRHEGRAIRLGEEEEKHETFSVLH